MDDKASDSALATSQLSSIKPSNDSPPAKPVRRVSIFSILTRLAVAALIIVGAGFIASVMVGSREEPPQRGNFERSFTVETVPAERKDFTVPIQSFGQVEAAKVLELRAQAGGEITQVSDNLRPGARVTAGEILVQVDRFDHELAVANAELNVETANLDLLESQEQLELQRRNLEFAQDQLEVAKADLERAQTLLERGTITAQALEARELVVSQREQTVRQTQTSIKAQETALQRTAANIEQAQRALSQAERTLANTEIVAPFDGIVLLAQAVEGVNVNANEVVAQIYDLAQLEVRFSISEQEFGQFSGQPFAGQDVNVVWEATDPPQNFAAELSRRGAEVDASLGSVELIARIKAQGAQNIRPGTFVSVQLEGPTFQDVLILPETALYENDHFYISSEGRMVRTEAKILARDGSLVAVQAEVADEANIIVTRLSQAGEGIKVQTAEEAAEAGAQGNGFAGNGPPGGGPPGGGRGPRPGGG